jgi:hypothetical protein
LKRRDRFLFGFIVVTALFALPIMIAASINAFQWLAVFLVCYSLGVFQVYRMTIRNIKVKYPLVNPEGHPDVYSGRIPRPIYEDMQRYPWFFSKKRKAAKKAKKRREKD